MKLTERIKEERIALQVEAATKDEMIGKLVDLVVNGYDRQAVLDAILQREELGSTGIGHGVAVPHVRLDSVKEADIAFGRSVNAIDLDALDGEPCTLFFLVLGPTSKEGQEMYLQTMAKISRLMRNNEIREALSAAASPADVMSIITSNES